ncbi:Integral membrane protein [Pleurostoma richardsiae]|uniref:Integral membrane protein n=1 Tax=Pleurostoma richardsiae TaxID=41990 RepID=A0AA38VMB0_9PEZI|nr:Integral membrane protein [Pleurostoma richardsiae]
MGAEEANPDPDEYPPTYFAHPEHRGVIYTHITLMTLAWVLMLPVCVMLSIARSRYTLASQFVFLVTNAIGVVFSTIYNASTPDLYPNNAHHKLGWLVTWVVSAQVVVGLLARVVGAFASGGKLSSGDDRRGFIPVSTEAMAEHQRWNDPRFSEQYRTSNDSGQGTEPNTESLRSHSLSSNGDEVSIPLHDARKEYGDDDEDDLEVLPALPHSAGKIHSIAAKVAGKISERVWKVLIFAYNFVDRTILILGFITFCTGIIAFGRFFEGRAVFTGLAHWIKGGIFFWLGLLTLGRWAGSFGDLGWAWNIKPRSARRRWTPSSEFVESALIFVYGSTNIFMEHLSNPGGEWSPQDMEHISITVLFIGGGLCGMLIESVRVRDLLNTTVTEAAQSLPEHAYDAEERNSLQEPEAYSFSMNPIPALVILLLGVMMGSHTQATMISSMVHKQWGNLLAGASFARGLTYLITYLKPPRSVLPSRPPTELLTSFGLIAGGIMFMASSGDTVQGMIHYDLDAMFMYTVVLGFVGLIMAWEIIVLALKGWAVRKEAGRPAGSHGMA